MIVVAGNGAAWPGRGVRRMISGPGASPVARLDWAVP